MPGASDAGSVLLALLLTLTTALHEGLVAFKGQQWDEAIAKLTLVADQEVPGNQFRTVAYFYRAQSYAAKGDKARARADLYALARATDDAALLQPSLVFYKEWGGDDALLPVPRTPVRAWEDLLKACKDGKVGDARTLAVDALAETFGQESFDEKAAKEFYTRHGALVPKSVSINRPPMDDDGEATGPDTAELTLTTADGKGPELVVTLQHDGDQDAAEWYVARTGDEGAAPAPEGVVPDVVAVGEVNNIIVEQNNLRQLVLGLRGARANVVINGAGIDGGVEEIGGAQAAAAPKPLTSPDGQPVRQWKNPQTGTSQPFAYRRNVPAPADTEAGKRLLIAAAPAPVDGQRDVMYWGGRTGQMPEDAFEKFALGVAWRAPGPLTLAQVPAATRTEVETLVGKLGADDAAVRRAAKQRLRELGAAALPVLITQRNHADLEVRMTVRELLGE